MCPFFNNLLHCLRRFEFRLLREIAERNPFLDRYFAEVVGVDAGDESQKRALPGAVQSEDSDFRPVEEREVDVLQDLAVRLDDLADAGHGEYDLVIAHE